MKYLLIALLLFVGVSASSQTLPQLKDSAKVYYFQTLEMMNVRRPGWTREAFDSVNNKYDYYREAVLGKIKKEDQQAFFNWLVSEARATGKLKRLK